jgi:mannosyl-glycoprotein endo-beta-N-acetylglucosaminidase
VALSFDPSLLLRPDVAGRGLDRAPSPTPGEQAEFATALSRARLQAEPAGAQAPTLVAARRTRLSGEQAAAALRSAWTSVRGTPPSDETLSLLVGQWAHETGRGASMLNYNFGGVKGTGPSGMSVAASTREGFGAEQQRVTARFRAYGSAEEGARDYVSLLARRYPDAVQAAEGGDARGFVQALKARGYFTDDEAAYARSVQSLAAHARSAGFAALGAPEAAASADEAGPSLALGADAMVASSAPDARAFADSPLAGVPIAPGAFADEVNRAALLMSALRIGEPRRDG